MLESFNLQLADGKLVVTNGGKIVKILSAKGSSMALARQVARSLEPCLVGIIAHTLAGTQPATAPEENSVDAVGC